MGKQGGFFEEVVCDSSSRVCDSNERLKEYLEGALSKAGLESFVTVMPRRDGYRIYTGEKPDAPFVYVDVYLDGDSVVVEGSSKRNLSESEMGDLARFLGISGKEAGEKLNKFRRFIDVLQKHAGEDVDKLEDLKVSDAVYVDAKNRNGGSPVRYMSGERLGRPVNHARPSGSGVTRGRDYVSKVDGGQRVGKPVQRAKVSDSKASDLSKISGALKLVKENFKVSGKPAEIKGITLDLKDLGGAIVSVKAYSKDKEPKITVEARTSDGKRRGFDYGIDAKASHVYGDLASLGKVEDSTPARWLGGKRISDASEKSTSTSSARVSAPELKAALEAEAPSTLASSGNTSGPSISVEDEGDYFEVSIGSRGKVVSDIVRRVADKFGLSCTYSPGLSSTTSVTYLLKPASVVSDGDTKISVSGDTDRSLWFDTVSKRLHADSSFTVEDDTKDLVSGYYKLGDGNEGHISLHPDKIVFYAYEDPTDMDSDPLEIAVPFTFYNKVESILALLYFVQATDDAYDYVDVVRTVKKTNRSVSDSVSAPELFDEPGIEMVELLSLLHSEGYIYDQAGDGSIEVFIPVESGGVKLDFESTNAGLRSALNGKLGVVHISVFDGENTAGSWDVLTPGLSELKDLLGYFKAFGGDASDTIATAIRVLNDYFGDFSAVAVNDSADAEDDRLVSDLKFDELVSVLGAAAQGYLFASVVGSNIRFIQFGDLSAEDPEIRMYDIPLEGLHVSDVLPRLNAMSNPTGVSSKSEFPAFDWDFYQNAWNHYVLGAVSDSSDAPRTDCVFPKDSPDVNDGKCHYPLNSLARARAAIAYANKMTEKPTWYSGDLDVAGLVKKIVNAAKAAYPSIDVSPESYEPKKD